jgi:hypothetical protein
MISTNSSEMTMTKNTNIMATNVDADRHLTDNGYLSLWALMFTSIVVHALSFFGTMTIGTYFLLC